jgi:hypothetical protein
MVESDIHKRARRRWRWVLSTIHNGAFTVTALSLALILLMGFQSWELQSSNHHIDQEAKARRDETIIINRQSAVIKELSDHVIDDEKFFGLIRQLVILGNSQTPEAQAERQAILNQLKQQEEQAQRQSVTTTTTTTTTQPPRGNSTPPTTQPSRSPPSTTTTTSSTTTTIIPSPVPLPPLPCIPVPLINKCSSGRTVKRK